MSSTEAANTVLAFVQSGQYPEANRLVTSPIAPNDLCLLRKQLLETKSSAQAEIRRISNQTAPDVDGWIRRAKEVQADIEESRLIARNIVSQATEAEQLHAKSSDASAKVTLLQEELTFNTKLQDSLSQIKGAAAQFRSAQQLAMSGHIESSLHRLQDLELTLEDLDALRTTTPLELLRQRVEDLKGSLVQQANDMWQSVILLDKTHQKLHIRSDKRSATVEDAARICASLNLLDTNVLKFARDVQRVILLPLFAGSIGSASPGISCYGEKLSLDAHGSGRSKTAILDDLESFVKFMAEKVPASVCQILSRALMPAISSRLENNELSTAVATSLNDFDDFQNLLGRVITFNNRLSAFGWSTATALAEWPKSAPKVWLSKRRERSIDVLRTLLPEKTRDRRSVERIETQEVSVDEVSLTPAQAGNEDEWNEDWDDDDDGQHRSPAVSKAQKHRKAEQASEPDDDWGWDEQESNGQDDKADVNAVAPIASRAPAALETRSEGNGATDGAGRKRLTLRESYQTTGVPHELQRLIWQLIKDADELSSGDTRFAAIASAANAVLTIPTLLIATYRALAPTHYEVIAGGLMYLYNDSTWLAEDLQKTADSLASTNAKTFSRLKLGADVDSLHSFGKRAYGRAMEGQRTIVRDLIDNAQGFGNCTLQPFASACDGAVAATVAHVRGMADEWRGILSRSALLQSLGNIVAAAISKVILDIEEMSDIGDEESKQLRKYCQEICELSDLFADPGVANNGENGDASGAASLYIPNWFKFQYLMELLESSLADIKFLWAEPQGLRNEFDVNELVDLIEALFADNDHRRRAITEIKR